MGGRKVVANEKSSLLSIPSSTLPIKMSAPTLAQIQSLYAASQAAARRFTSYNFHHYFVRRTEEKFQPVIASLQASASASASSSTLSPAQLSEFYAREKESLAVIERAAGVNRMFEGPKLVVEHAEPITGGGGAGMEASAGGGGQPI